MPTSCFRRRRSPRSVLALAALAAGPLLACRPVVEAPAPRPAALDALVDSITAAPPLHRTQWGIAVYESATGRMLYGHGAELNFVPASNMKLVTGAAALAELGPDYRFETHLLAVGAQPGDTVADALLVLGRGDPTLSARFHGRPFAALDSLADSVAVAGIRRFRDGVVVEALYFDDVPFHGTWTIANLPFRYTAGTAAFGIEEGTILVELRPGRAAGAPARAAVLPAPGTALVGNDLVTGPVGSEREVVVRRRIPGDSLVLSGSIPLGAPVDTMQLAAPDPADHAARSLAAALTARGMVVDGEVRVLRDTAEVARLVRATPLLRDTAGAAPHAGATPPVQDTAGMAPPAGGAPLLRLAAWRSPPLSEIVPAFMLPSQNWIAEQLVKTIGAERRGQGSWEAGIAVQAELLAAVAGDTTGFALRDGSGLSVQNLLSPAVVIRLLEHARGQPWAEHFLASLPRPGQEGGTLAGRLHGLEDRVAAKTGTITHVNGLSGYIVTRSGREISFSILTNATGVPAAPVRAAMDRIVREIAEW